MLSGAAIGSLWLLLVTSADARPTLVKVIVLGRHGNRLENAPVRELCPGSAKHIKWAQNKTWEAALSPLGEVQCSLAGNYLRQTYVDASGHESLIEHPQDDHSTYFMAENADRNVACIHLVKGSLFPHKEHTAALPVFTTTPGKDTVMNCGKNGPCNAERGKIVKEWDKTNEPMYKYKHGPLLEKLSEVCGFDFFSLKADSPNGAFGGKSLSWALKQVVDALEFAKYENMDVSLGGRLSSDFIQRITTLAKTMTEESSYGEEKQVTYLVGDFPQQVLFDNIRRPNPEDTQLQIPLQGIHLDEKKAPWAHSPLTFYYHNRFLVLWNHRELMTGLLKLFGGTFADGSPIPEAMHTASMIIWEIWEDGEEQFIRYFQWELDLDPHTFSDIDLPWPHIRPGALHNTSSVSARREIFPNFCEVRGRCTLNEFEGMFEAWTNLTGTWREICKVPASALSAEADAMKGVESGWGLTLGSALAMLVGLLALQILVLARNRRASRRDERGYSMM